jgi:hypothetical protein
MHDWPWRGLPLEAQESYAASAFFLLDYEEFIGAKKHLVLGLLPQTG